MSQPTRQKKTHEAPITTPAATRGADVAKDHGGPPAADHIRIRAYEIFQARNGGPGNALADWIRAEQEVTARRGAKL